MRLWVVVALLGTACSGSTGEGWAEDKLGKTGAALIKSETLAFIEGRSTPLVEPSAAHCPSPRVVLDYYPPDRAPTARVEFSRVSKLAKDSVLIKGESSVRCIVVAGHDAKGRKRSFKEWMIVRLIDRETKTDVLTKIQGNDEDLAKFLATLPP